MAKKKTSKSANKKNDSYAAELWGVLLILVAIMGFGAFGPVGNIIKGFAIFLMGTWYVVALLACFAIGIYMIVKRKNPNYITIRLLGLYMIILAFLVYSHMEYALQNHLEGQAIIKETLDNFLKEGALIYPANSGGGIIGGIFTIILTNCFAPEGTRIVLACLAFLGLILLFDLSIGDIVDWFKSQFAKMHNTDDDDDDGEEEEDTTPRKKKSLLDGLGRGKERSIEDTICTESLENVKVYSSVGELLNGASAEHGQVEPKEEVQLSLSSSNDAPVENKNYKLPSLDILDKPKVQGKVNSTEFLQSNKAALERVLQEFQISGRVVEIHEGPAITQFEVEIKAGTKVSRITSISKEIALALAAKTVRIEAPIPGKSTVGIEIPNTKIVPVPLREVLSRPTKDSESAKVPVALGKDIMGRIKWADIYKMPHLLVAGATGSGKSVCINSFIASILMLKRPDEVKLVLVDPKKVELSNYNGIPHLLWPVVTNPKKASAALQKVVAMMEERYRLFEDKKVKNITSYNEWVEEENRRTGNDAEKKMGYLVVIIDELADLMVVAKKDVEESIMRITQMARAAGIHLIVATQRPSTDVITGVIKANIPSRIAFTVSSQIDSRTILDQGGAEKLLGKGDMLYYPMGATVPERIQGNFISDDEIERLIKYVCEQQAASYDNSLEETPDSHMAGENSPEEEYDDPLYNEIVEFAVQTGKISASLIQRRFKLGYNRAARIVDLLEERGIVGPQNGSKPREVLVKVENNN
ncbi:MAG TPA: cell division protein FtsK [Firmicutes bacterium]|nr:cell division protein FtsK [Bacillota bacterium]